MRLLFDLDGTITDSFPGIARSIQHALAELGRPYPAVEELRWCLGPPLKPIFARLLGPEHEHLADHAILKYRERFVPIGMFENTVYPGIEAALSDLLRAGHSLSIATSKPRVYAERIVEHFGLRKHFVSVDGAELDGTRGDKSSLIAYIVARDRLAPDDMLMIGDREHDMAGARANGIAGLGVLWGYGSEIELKAAGARGCCASPSELPKSVDEIARRGS